MEKARCSMKVIFSCFDCPYFQNRSAHPDIKKEKYRCMVEGDDFSFDKMFPLGMPEWCPLPYFDNIKAQPGFAQFKEILDKIEHQLDNQRKGTK